MRILTATVASTIVAVFIIGAVVFMPLTWICLFWHFWRKEING